MSSIADLLRNALISETEIVCDSHDSNCFIYRIRNSDKEERLKEIIIRTSQNSENEDLTNNIFVFTFDIQKRKLKNTQLISLKWIDKKCDGIIYHYKNDNHYFILCEIKTNVISGCKSQLDSMEAFLSYLIKAIEIEAKSKVSIRQSCKLTRILFSTRINKDYSYKNRDEVKKEKLNAYEITCEIGKRNIFNIDRLLEYQFHSI